MHHCLLILTALLCVQDISSASYTMFVNDDRVQFNDVLWVDRNSPVHVSCRISTTTNHAVLKKIVEGREYTLGNAVSSFHDPYMFLNYTLSDADKWSLVTVYRCVDRTKPYYPNYSQVTLSFRLPLPPPASTLPPGPPAISATTLPPTRPPPSNIHSTRPSSGATAGHRAPDLNPLIYTVSVLVLLGTLAIVGIITCWIRARRSYNRRMFQATTNPQDYLDYIGDNDFTPLTTNEFVASLNERPPTYNESEEMRPGEAGGTHQLSSTRTPPPRPPPPMATNSNSPQPRPQSCEVDGTGERSGTQSSSTRTPPPGPPPPTNFEPQPLTSTGSSGNVPDVSEDRTATGADSGNPSSQHVLIGVDALLSMDLETGNGTQQSQLAPLPMSRGAAESVAIGTLIEFDFGDSSSSALDTN